MFKGKCILKRKAALGGQYFQRLSLYFADQSLCVVVADENIAGDLLAENQGNQHISRRQGTADFHALLIRIHTDDRTLVLLLVQLQLLLNFTGKGKNNFLTDFAGGRTVVVGYQEKLPALVISFCHKHNPLCFQSRTQALDNFVAQVMKIDNRRQPLAQVLDCCLIRMAFGNYDGINKIREQIAQRMNDQDRCNTEDEGELENIARIEVGVVVLDEREDQQVHHRGRGCQNGGVDDGKPHA
ncbi:hypothetical protein DSECCO2_644230 [anaerobic digester metagenome]